MKKSVCRTVGTLSQIKMTSFEWFNPITRKNLTRGEIEDVIHRRKQIDDCVDKYMFMIQDIIQPPTTASKDIYGRFYSLRQANLDWLGMFKWASYWLDAELTVKWNACKDPHMIMDVPNVQLAILCQEMKQLIAQHYKTPRLVGQQAIFADLIQGIAEAKTQLVSLSARVDELEGGHKKEEMPSSGLGSEYALY